jgi:hypothetical protein
MLNLAQRIRASGHDGWSLRIDASLVICQTVSVSVYRMGSLSKHDGNRSGLAPLVRSLCCIIAVFSRKKLGSATRKRVLLRSKCQNCRRTCGTSCRLGWGDASSTWRHSLDSTYQTWQCLCHVMPGKPELRLWLQPIIRGSLSAIG